MHKNNIEKYISCKKKAGRSQIPGHGYYAKLQHFYQLHFKRGELYLEYLKGSCQEGEELCDFCATWSGPKSDYVPRPYPDYKASGFHYLPARQTPVRDENGNIRPIDDFQPRAALKNRHQQNPPLTSSDAEQITEFTKKYIVQENLVRNYLLHLENLALMIAKRQNEEEAKKGARKHKNYEDYNWKELYENRNIASLKVPELNKYPTHQILSKKADKMKKNDSVVCRRNDTVSWNAK